MANSIWMASEFYGFSDSIAGSIMGGKVIATLFFGIGIAVLVVYFSYKFFSTYKRI
jgi:hypothetical protein